MIGYLLGFFIILKFTLKLENRAHYRLVLIQWSSFFKEIWGDSLFTINANNVSKEKSKYVNYSLL